MPVTMSRRMKGEDGDDEYDYRLNKKQAESK